MVSVRNNSLQYVVMSGILFCSSFGAVAQSQIQSTQQKQPAGWQTFSLPEKERVTVKTRFETTEKRETELDAKQKEKPKRKRPRAKKKTGPEVVRIISSSIDNSSLSMANDLARLLDDGKTLRVVPIVGKGTAQSLKDIYYLKGVDVGIIQTDVLHYYKSNKKLPNPDRFIRYITTLGTQEVHVIARRNIRSIKELSGKSVNIGPLEGGNAITASAVLRAHGVKVNSVHMDNRAALTRLKSGAIDAVVVVGGKPITELLRSFLKTEAFHLLDVNFNNKLQRHYNPTVMIYEDYPGLIAKDRVVSSVSVDMVMVMYFWPRGTSRYRRVNRFVTSFFSRLHELKTPVYHSKWKEVRLTKQLKGWRRFRAATDWLKKHRKKLEKYSRLPLKK